MGEEDLKNQCSKWEQPRGSNKKELNSAHFQLGHDQIDYGTTDKESYQVPKSTKDNDPQAARESARRLRSSNVTLGCDPVPKVSSHRDSYQAPDPNCEAFHP